MKLTRKQQLLYEFYMDQRNWKPPSYTTLMKYMGVKSKNSIHKQLQQLKKKGYL